MYIPRKSIESLHDNSALPQSLLFSACLYELLDVCLPDSSFHSEQSTAVHSVSECNSAPWPFVQMTYVVDFSGRNFRLWPRLHIVVDLFNDSVSLILMPLSSLVTVISFVFILRPIFLDYCNMTWTRSRSTDVRSK